MTTNETFLNQLDSELVSVRSGTTLEWETINPVLQASEFGMDSDTNKLKVGDGQTAWVDLPYLVSSDTLSNDIEGNPDPVVLTLARVGRVFPTDLEATSLDPEESYDGVIELAPTCIVLHVSFDFPSRLRIYLDEASRTADALRAIGASPVGGNHGVLLDIAATDTDDLVWTNVNAVCSKFTNYDIDGSFPITITNLDEEARISKSMLSYLPLEYATQLD